MLSIRRGAALLQGPDPLDKLTLRHPVIDPMPGSKRGGRASGRGARGARRGVLCLPCNIQRHKLYVMKDDSQIASNRSSLSRPVSKRMIHVDGLSAPQRYWAFATVVSTVALATMEQTIANVALPTISGVTGTNSEFLLKRHNAPIQLPPPTQRECPQLSFVSAASARRCWLWCKFTAWTSDFCASFRISSR
jgi:hypothetical protein